MNNAIKFTYVITDELVNIQAGFMNEVAAINWAGQMAILTMRDLLVYRDGEHVGRCIRHDGRFVLLAGTERSNVVPFVPREG